MSGIQIDPEKLDPKARADFLNVLRAEEQRLEVESVEARRRIDAAETQEILDDIERQGRQKRQAAARTAELANRRINGALTKVQTHLERASDRSLSSQERRAEETVARDAFRRIEEWRDIAETMQRSAKVVEPDIYGPHSPYSYFADLAALADQTNPEHRAAALARLDAYGNDLARDQGKAGLRARRAWRERSRTDIGFQAQSQANYRALSSGGTSGGAMIPPIYLPDQYALYRSYTPAVADACNDTVPLPTFGMQVSVPQDLSGAGVSAVAENTDPGSSNFTSQYITQPVKLYFGYTEISQALYDRSGPTKFDQVVYAQLRASLDAAVDSAVIAALIAAATTNLTRATWTDMSSLWSDVNHAASTLENTNGTLLPATHAFIPPTSFRWFAAQVDSSKRPIWAPSGDAAPDPNTGFTGYRIASTGVFTDGGIPTSGSNAQLLVSNPGSTLLLRGEPYAQAIPQTDAGTLSVLVRLYQYVSVVVRYPSATATVGGAAYPATPTWA